MLIIFMISLVSLSGFAGQSFPKISKSEIKNLSYNKLQMLRNSLVTFNQSFDDQIKLKHEYSYIKFLINSAYAAESNMCFFGGWPSRKVGKYCQAPWKHRGDKEIKEMDLYSKNITCGSNSKFRCNPVLFGSDAKSDKGICIDTGGTYKNLTDKCEEQSRQNIDGLIEDYKNDPTKLDDYLKKVTQFCNTMPEYDACDSLSKRLNSITGKGNIKKNTSLNKPNQAKAILDTCQEKALAQDNDIHGRNILEQISDLDGCKPKLATDMNSIEDFKKISDSVEKSQYLAKVNEVAFKESIKAFIGNSFKFKVDDKVDKAISSQKDLKEYLKSNAPHLFKANEDGMDKALDEAFNEINSQVKEASLVRFDPNEAANSLNEYAKVLNDMCSNYFNEKEAMFGKQNKIQRAWDNENEELHYLEQNKKFSKVLDEMLQNTTAGYLISSDHFKDNVFDPSVNMAEECSYSKNYKLFNDKLSKIDITKGTKDINSLLKKNLKEISNTQNSIAKGDTSEVDDHLREYLKSDPSIVRMTLSHLDNSSGSEFASYICTETLDIYDSDETWRYVDWTVAGLGVTAGVVLTATGVGSPLGVALTTASIGLAGFEATSATLSYMDAQKREAASDRAQIEKRKELQEYMSTQMTTNGQKTEALWTGGLAMVGVIPVAKIGKLGKSAVVSETGVTVVTKSDDLVKTTAVTKSVTKEVTVPVKTNATRDVAKLSDDFLSSGDNFKAFVMNDNVDDVLETYLNFTNVFNNPPKGMSGIDYDILRNSLEGSYNELKIVIRQADKLEKMGKVKKANKLKATAELRKSHLLRDLKELYAKFDI